MRWFWDILGILLLAVLGFFFIAFLIAAVQVSEREDYKIGRYTDTEVMQIFETSENDFLQIAKIVSETSDFWESKRAFDNPHAYINSPNNDNKLKCFRKEDRETLIAFFRTWKPVIVSYDNQKWVRIVFANEDVSDFYTFGYLTEENPDEETLQAFLSYLSQNSRRNVEELGEQWYFSGELSPYYHLQR